MTPIRTQKPAHDIEMGTVSLRDASHPLSDAPTPHATDTVVVSTAAGRFKKRLLAAATVGGTLLGGSLVAAIAVPLLKQQRDKAVGALGDCQANLTRLEPNAKFEAWLEQQLAPAPGDWIPSDDPANTDAGASSRPALPGRTSCVAPNFATEASFQSITTDDAPLNAPGPLFSGSLPRVGDQYRVNNGGISFLNFGSTIMLESMAALHPEFLGGNLRSAGTDANGTHWFESRVFNRPTALGTPTQAWIRAAATTDAPLDASVPVWPIIASRAANAVFSVGDALQTPGDTNDNNDLERQAATAISGAPIQSMPLNRAAQLIALRKVNQFNESSNDPAALFQDKDDNIPFAVEMMKVNPLLFGSVQFNRGNFDLLPQNVTTLPGGTVLRNLGDMSLSVEPQGRQAWQISSADKSITPWTSEFAITGMHAEGLDLRLATDAPSAPSRFLPYEALTYAADTLNLGRINCGQRQLTIS